MVRFKWLLLTGKYTFIFVIRTFKFAVLISFLHFTLFVAYMKLYVKKVTEIIKKKVTLIKRACFVLSAILVQLRLT